MSTLAPLFTWRSAISDSNLPPITRHVALALSLYMNERGGSAFPGATRLAHDTGLSSKTVYRHLEHLEETGWLEVVKQGGGRGHATAYRAAVPGAVVQEETWTQESTNTTDDERETWTLATETWTPEALNVDSGVQPTPSNSPELSILPPRDATAGRPRKSARKPDELWDAVMDACHVATEAITTMSRGGYNAAVKSIRDAGGQPLQVAAAAAKYRRTYDKIPTPQALAKHWPQMVEHAPRSSNTCPKCQQPNGAAHNERSCQMIQRAFAETA